MGGGSNINVKDFKADRQLAKLTKKYKLTDAEKAKIQPILAEQEKEIHTLGDDTNLSDSEWTAAVRRVHSETVAKVKLEMTDAQVSEYAKDEEKQAKRDAEDDQMQGPPDGGPPPGPPPGGGGGPPM